MSPTWIKRDLAEHDPLCSKPELQFDVFANPAMQFHSHVPRPLNHQVRNVWEMHWLATVMTTANAEEDSSLRKNLK